MAMFLSRLKQILNLESKSVTADTSQQTVTPDVGYDGLGQVIINPQVHTQTFFPGENTPNNDMGVNHNYRYVDTLGMHSTIGLTPSNNNPPTITNGRSYTALGTGKAVSSVTDVTPTNVAPPSLSSGTIYKPSASGYAISSYNETWPDDDDPPRLNYENVYCIRGISGYLYQTKQPQVKKGTFTTSGSSVTNFTVNVGFQPDTIIIFFNGNGGSMSGDTAANGAVRYIYDKDTNATYGFRAYRSTSSSMTVNMAEVGASGDTRVSSITSTGFVWRNAADSKWNGTHTYIAIKW